VSGSALDRRGLFSIIINHHHHHHRRQLCTIFHLSQLTIATIAVRTYCIPTSSPDQ
jgi:hypothetical protein